jgi:hypothetical protein
MGQKRSKPSNVLDSSLEQGRIAPGSTGGQFPAFTFSPQNVAFSYSPQNLNLNVGDSSHLSGWGGMEPLQNLPGNSSQQQQQHNPAEDMDQFNEPEYIFISGSYGADFDFQDSLLPDFEAEEPQQSRIPVQSSSDSANSTEPETEDNNGDAGVHQNNGKGRSSATDAEGSGRSVIKKQKARGPFLNEEDREETSQNRKDRVCLRCRMQHLRVRFVGFRFSFPNSLM